MFTWKKLTIRDVDSSAVFLFLPRLAGSVSKEKLSAILSREATAIFVFIYLLNRGQSL